MPPKSPKSQGSKSKGSSFIENWLDDEDHQKRGKPRPKKKPAKSAALPLEESNATVSEVFPNQARVRLDEGSEILCTYRRAQVISVGTEDYRERTPVAVGDRVRAEKLNPQSGVIDGICARRCFLARPAPGRDDPNLIHVIAANLDLLVIVASVDLPEFSPGLVDRYLIASEAAGIPTLLCVTKSDLIKAGEPLWEEYGKLGYRWLLTSAKKHEHVEELKKEVAGKTTAFCGHSGVGKTSVFRELTRKPEFGKVGEVNLQTGKGKHTTTSAVLHWDEATKSNWIDTPGVREFGLRGVKPESLKDYFPEFRDLDCAKRGCSHVGAPECQASGLFRHQSYLRIYDSLVNP